MARRKQFNANAFLEATLNVLKQRKIDADASSLSNSTLNSIAEIIEMYGYEKALIFIEGKCDPEKDFTNSDNKKYLAIRDLILLIKEHADSRTFASYLVKSIKNLLFIHQKEGK